MRFVDDDYKATKTRHWKGAYLSMKNILEATIGLEFGIIETFTLETPNSTREAKICWLEMFWLIDLVQEYPNYE